MSNLPLNHGMPWLEEHDALLLKLFSGANETNVEYQAIKSTAEQFGRTEEGTICRLEKLILGFKRGYIMNLPEELKYSVFAHGHITVAVPRINFSRENGVTTAKPEIRIHGQFSVPGNGHALARAIAESTRNFITNYASTKEQSMICNRNANATEHFSGKKPFFVIYSPESDRPITQTFDTVEEAWEVADTMAEKHDGQRFFVLKSVGSSKVEKPVTRRDYVEEVVSRKKGASK